MVPKTSLPGTLSPAAMALLQGRREVAHNLLGFMEDRQQVPGGSSAAGDDGLQPVQNFRFDLVG